MVPEQYLRAQKGNYNGGAMFVSELKGVHVGIGKQNEILAPGCLAVAVRENAQSHQYSASPSNSWTVEQEVWKTLVIIK